jgi:hypothetical protein
MIIYGVVFKTLIAKEEESELQAIQDFVRLRALNSYILVKDEAEGRARIEGLIKGYAEKRN